MLTAAGAFTSGRPFLVSQVVALACLFVYSSIRPNAHATMT